ncbi:uncharacterized protein LOC107264854 [Cephus cinctus]|uniref:Uncharacterized protein LOC107264854 n=1 Tax=Cephus cinctus TaxID=211228 RepID=A0AAJ7BLG9_CEPCN|nr:uncharacterized protein LOC107264854 [Cephus cinctus]XP_015589048.1 uncharacterized protein LOC107264854 [Cephus cinctus]XP_015589050.1 uncharacterized protein LOC107264854 [Cephus cinctus]XP_015589051.1 uncharacterized protein LOC107264854 [Cephus cinctus]XP_024937821.1 uncharacterized protein LOC107264854 [Cephus cinctus]
MYAAAGGASIANRRKQKRLQLNRRGGDAVGTPAALAPRIRSVPTSHSSKFARSHFLPPSSAPVPLPSSANVGSHERHKRLEKHHHHHHHQQQQQEQQQHPQSQHHHHRNFHHNHHHYQHQLVPLSPAPFPISPPPLSLESPNSFTFATKSNSFPFPPPSILDLRVSPSTSELQCGGQGPGKAAWQGCNRPSPLPLSPASPHGSRGEGPNYKTKQCEAHRRWMNRNRIRDASNYYGSSGEDEDEEGSGFADRRRGEVSAAVNTVLYAGLGTTALGLVISFVGTGEKGFQSPELRLVGPSLLCAGLLCCLLRVLLCLCLCHCGECRWRPCVVFANKKKGRKADTNAPTGPLPTASLLPPIQQQQKQLQQPPMPSSCPVPSTATKGHELLLSPAQLPE